ncbi:MAG: hypothetical protein JNK15_00765 [Planctomycetes bacterium]|nr:hypothetical protein [Planctomycetota bacterium]
MPSQTSPLARRLSVLFGCLFATACVSSFDPDDDGLVVGSEIYATPFVVTGKGPVQIQERRGQVGEHRGGVYRAWRIQTLGEESLSPWLTTTPLVDERQQPRLRVTASGELFAFDPGAPLDSRDQQSHGARGWYRIGASGPIGAAFDSVELRIDGGYETSHADGEATHLRRHDAAGALRHELAIRTGSARPTGKAGWQLVQRAADGVAVVVDDTLRERGRIADRATAPGEWIEHGGRAMGLDEARGLVTSDGESLAGPWQSLSILVDRDLAVPMLVQPDGGLTLVDPGDGLRVLMRDATFALAQSRQMPAEYSDVGWGAQASVLLAGTKSAAGDGYVLFALVDGQVRGPFAAATSEATTAAMWSAVAPLAAARRDALARARADAAAATAAAAAELQRSVDRNQAKLDAVDREQIAYFDAVKVGDLTTAGGAIARMERQLEEFFVPQGHARTEAMRQQFDTGGIYFLDWELRRTDRSLPRLAERAAEYFRRGGGIYRRFCVEASRLLVVHDGMIARAHYDALYRHSYGFPKEGKDALAWHYDRLERVAAEARYRAHLAAGRFTDAHGMAYQLGFEGWVEHLLTQAKGKIADGELEALLRIAVDRAPTPALQEKLRTAHHAQWLDTLAAAQREQRERFRRIDEELRRAQVGEELARRQRWADFKLEAQKRGFLWTDN